MKIFRLSGIVLLFLMLVTTVANASVTITSQGGWFESAYVEFTPDGSSYYNVYYSTNQSDWTKIDDQLVRKYSASMGRADVLGLAAGTYYVKVASVNANGAEVSSVVSNALNVKAHDRGGFAHFNNANKVGAYKDDGTLKSGANVLYIAKANAKTISMTVPSASNKTAIYTGLQTIINAWTKAYSKGWSTAPLDIRVLGTLSYDDMDTFSSSAEGIQIKGESNYADCPITLEGVGNDAVIHGFGFLIRNMQNLELRNFAIMNCLDDAVSIDSNNSHIWVHNLDLFYGNAGSDKDQVKGDGTVDMKGDSKYITVSYNHFWDTGKSSLCGMKSETGPNYITYHHNWFDHSDSRHPRIRTMSVHVYNNYFDGVSKYGTGVTMGASAFVDRNYFRSCKYPMLSSMQGSDVYGGSTTRNPGSYGTFSSENTGIIKSYGNYMTGNCTYITYGASTYLLHGATTSVGSINTTQDFDAYEVSNPATPVPSNVTGYQGASTYNNFDTDPSLMYSYTADNAQDVPSVVQGSYGAGRMQHGTYQHTFTSADDTDYGVIASLKSDVQGYKSTSYYVGVTNSMYYKENVINDSPVEPGGEEEEEPETPTTSTDATLKSLTVSGYSLSFSPSQTSYSVTLAYDAESAPAVSAIANNNNATVSISQATSTTGKATIVVTAEDGTTKKIYEVQFSIGSEPAPSGSSISSAMTINIGDGSGYTSYLTGTYNTSTSLNATTYHGVTNSTKCIKMETSTAIEFTTTKAFTMTFVADASQTASFKIDGTTVAGTGNTVSVDVAAGTHTLTKSGAIKMCFLDFAETSDPIEPEPVLSDDATLSALSVAGYSLTPAFSSSTFTYSVELAAGTTSVPTITATPNHANAHAYVDAESCHPAGQAIIDVEAEDGTSGKYYINFTVATAYYNVSASAGAGGSAEVTPSGSVEEGTQVVFTATPNSGYTFSMWSDNSTENPHAVTVTGDLTLTATFTENSPTPSGDEETLFSAVATAALSVPGGSTDLQITSSNVTITGGSMYATSQQTDSKDMIKANGTPSKIAFSITNNNTFFKVVLNQALEAGDQINGIVYTRTDAEQGLWLSTATPRPDNAPTSRLILASVASEDDVAWTSLPTYTVAEGDGICGETTFYIYRSVGKTVYFTDFTITREGSAPSQKSTDATLSDLQVNGTTVSGFNASTTVYDVVLPYGTTAVPTVAASKNHDGASVNVTQASSTSGTATIIVTAEDGITVRTYKVNFSVSTSIVLTDAANYVDGTFAAGDVTYTRATTAGKYGSFCLPFDFNASEAAGIAKVYVPINIAVYNTTTNKLRLFLAIKTGVIEAGTPFVALLNGPTSIVNSSSVTFTSVMSNPPTVALDVFDSDGSDGTLLENENITLTWCGSYVSTPKVDGMMAFNSNGNFNYLSPTVTAMTPFRAYMIEETNSGQSIDIELSLADDATAIDIIKSEIARDKTDVYTVGGTLIKKNVSSVDALEGLAPGVYVVKGKKIVK